MIVEREIERQDFADWNRTVQGFMRIWDVAEVIGVTPCLTQHLEAMPRNETAENLAQRGNCRETYLKLFMLSLRELLNPNLQGSGSAPEPAWEKQLLSALDVAVVHQATPFFHLLTECGRALERENAEAAAV